jgi:DNA-binding NarL/FixJ family response regulator
MANSMPVSNPAMTVLSSFSRPMALRILVVEDHAPFREFTCRALRRRAEFEAFEAADGLEAIRKADELQPDVILLDLNLPGMHGFEIARQIPAIVPRAQVLFLTQESSPDIVEEALRLGARGYIHKVSAATDLLPAIDAVVAGQRFVSRSLGIEAHAVPAPRRHEMLFCPDAASVVDALTRFVAAALRAGDAAIVLVTDSHRAHLLQQLRAQGVDIDRACLRGICQFMEGDVAPESVRFLATIDRARAAATIAGKAHPRVACSGEAAGRLWAAGRTAEAVQLEESCRGLPHDVDILCVYPVPHALGDEALTRIRAEHTSVSSR